MMKRAICTLGVCLVLPALFASGAFADRGGAGTETFTTHEIEGFSFPAENACTGEEGVLTASPSTSVFHITTQSDGDSWITGTSEGTASFVPSGPGPTFAGHFTSWFGEAVNNKNTVGHATFTFVLSGPEGSHVVAHLTFHVSTNANGVVTVEREREHARVQCA
jgi:hypothetical protein